MGNYFIVGGSSGIGKSIVQKLAESGHKVFSTFNKTTIDSDSDNVEYHHLNVTSSDADLSYLPEVIDGFAYCPGSINLLPFARIKPADFAKDFELQVTGAIKILQQILPRLRKSDNQAFCSFQRWQYKLDLIFIVMWLLRKGRLKGSQDLSLQSLHQKSE